MRDNVPRPSLVPPKNISGSRYTIMLSGRKIIWVCMIAFAVGAAKSQTFAQAALKPSEPGTSSSWHMDEDLPDAPQPPLISSTAGVSATRVRLARRYRRTVRPDEYTVPLPVADKLKLSICTRLTLPEAFGTLVAAGWSQWNNIRPNYGTDAAAFGERVGGLTLKQDSQAFFSYGVYTSLFHDDPHYYVAGDSQPIVRRGVSSAVQAFVTRKDNGNRAVNWPRLAGIATATALTTFYYPKVNHGFGNESKAFAASFGSSILDNELHEFSADITRLFHLKFAENL
jgi:hypothetical protein